MGMNTLHKIFLLLVISVIGGCSAYNQVDFEQEYMVEAYVIADRTLPDVRLSLTQEAFQTYDFEQAAVSDALVQIELLDENSSVVRIFSYSNVAPGIYSVDDRSYKAESGSTYRLIVEAADATIQSELLH